MVLEKIIIELSALGFWDDGFCECMLKEDLYYREEGDKEIISLMLDRGFRDIELISGKVVEIKGNEAVVGFVGKENGKEVEIRVILDDLGYVYYAEYGGKL